MIHFLTLIFMNKTLLFLLLCFASTSTFSQTCELKHTLSSDDRKELLNTIKELFALPMSMDYTFSTNDLCATSDKMNKPPEAFDQHYLEKHEKLLQAEPANPIYAKALGDYYNFNEQYLLAKGYYEMALKHTDISYFKKDSSSYYSFRGQVHYTLEDSIGLQEFDKAVAINATDSMALTNYPTILLGLGQFDKAKLVCENALKKSEKYPSGPYILFAMAEILRQNYQNQLKVTTDSTLNKVYRDEDYNKGIDFAAIDDYTNRFAKDKKVQQARRMVDVLVLMSKMQYFTQNEDGTIKFSYTSNDLIALKALDNWFEKSLKTKSVNAFTAYKNLGYIQFMLNGEDKAISFFSKAIEVFPINKRGPLFNETDVYSGLLYIASQKKDKTLFKNTLLAKIKAEPAGKKNFRDYKLMAEMYLKEDSINQAMDWAVKAKAIYPSDCETLMLLSYLSQEQGYGMLSDSYFEEANKHISTSDEFINLSVLIMCYRLLNGSAYEFCSVYDNVESQLGKGNCTRCDVLKEKYVEVILAK
ncbi:MAG: hypothetical protein JWM14_1973 [Chitinophagaceae bacterium]|nr:hypothetical protein [Chitinophagaceae bacterium]